MTALALFVSTYALVFFLGVQSLAVNAGHRFFAFANSFAIGTANLILFKLAPDATGLEIAGYLCGGPFGILSAIEFFKWYRSKKA